MRPLRAVTQGVSIFLQLIVYPGFHVVLESIAGVYKEFGREQSDEEEDKSTSYKY